MSTAEEFAARIHAATADSPYVVTDTDDGFHMQLNVVDARWYTLMHKNGVKKMVRYEVTLSADKQSFSISDVATTMRWSGGVGGGPPRLGGSMTYSRGRIMDASGEKQWGFDADNRRLGKVVDYRFSTGEGHGIIRGVAGEVGWEETMPWSVKGALVVGVGTLVALVVVGLVVGAVKLFG